MSIIHCLLILQGITSYYFPPERDNAVHLERKMLPFPNKHKHNVIHGHICER